MVMAMAWKLLRRCNAWALANLEFEYIKYPVDEDNHPSRRIPEALKGVIASEYEVMKHE